jgi:hypothetical protein
VWRGKKVEKEKNDGIEKWMVVRFDMLEDYV